MMLLHQEGTILRIDLSAIRPTIGKPTCVPVSLIDLQL